MNKIYRNFITTVRFRYSCDPIVKIHSLGYNNYEISNEKQLTLFIKTWILL